MPLLSVYHLGTTEVILNTVPLTDFKSSKVHALLIYLITEVEKAHRRDVLAEMLWPDLPGLSASSNLRDAISSLRKLLGDRPLQRSDPKTGSLGAREPYLIVTRDSIQMNRASDYWADVSELKTQLTGGLNIERLEKAISIYKGPFLENFSIKNSPPFEDWVLFKREEINQLVSSRVQYLANSFEERSIFSKALYYARKAIELEPWREETHRQIMRLLAQIGTRSEALIQYEICRSKLHEELGVEPEQATIDLYWQIRNSRLVDGSNGSSIPLVPDEKGILPTSGFESPVSLKTEPVFVAQEAELASLTHHLDNALKGTGRVVFVSGDTGAGKTALINEFSSRAMQNHRELLVVRGHSNSHVGLGDPYQPFREILQLICGEAAPGQARGMIVQEEVGRLWSFLPAAAKILVETAPNLIDLMVSGNNLASRLEHFAPSALTVKEQLEGIIRRNKVLGSVISEILTYQQVDFYDQVTRFFQMIARQQPLVVILEDLHWADPGSLSLLFQIGRRLQNCRILIIGTYRPAIVAAGIYSSNGDQARHPLDQVVNEFGRDFGDIQIDLNRADGRHFIEAYLNLEPNHFDDTFRETLYRHTSGNPLFIIELMRSMQERGVVDRDQDGCWVEAQEPDWDTIPPRIEFAIAERMRSLPDTGQDILVAASVQGEEFITGLLAEVLQMQESQILRLLSGPISKQHGLVDAAGFEWIDQHCLTRYRFRHFLYQRYLYRQLGEGERQQLHAVNGQALENYYQRIGADLGPVLLKLAMHFEKAGMYEKAVMYLLLAGNRATAAGAFAEAISALKRGLNSLERLPQSSPRDLKELDLLLALAVPLGMQLGMGSMERNGVLARALQLAQSLGNSERLFTVEQLMIMVQP